MRYGRKVARNMDARLRQAQRLAALAGSMEAIEALALEATRAGTRTDWIVGLLRAWPRLKRGDFVAPDRLTVTQARRAIEGMLRSLGWSVIHLEEQPAVHFWAAGGQLPWPETVYPPGFPPERDDPTDNIRGGLPLGVWVSPDFNYYIEFEPRTVVFFHWRTDPNTFIDPALTVIAPPGWWHISTAHILEHPFESFGSVPPRWGWAAIAITEVARWLYEQAMRVLGLGDIAGEAQQRRTARSRRSPEHEDLLDRARQAGMFYGVTSQQYKEAQAALDAFLRARRRRRKGPPRANPPRGDDLLRELARHMHAARDQEEAREIYRQLALEQARRGLLITPFDSQGGGAYVPYRRVFFFFPNGYSASADYSLNSPAGDRINLHLHGGQSSLPGDYLAARVSPGWHGSEKRQGSTHYRVVPDSPTPPTLEDFWQLDGVQNLLRQHALRSIE